MLRVDADDLDEQFTAGGSRIIVFDDKPLTGVAYEMNELGNLWSEQAYEDGVLSGVSRDWYQNGQLQSETDYRWNRVHGHNRKWFENGQLKSDALVELGYIIRKQEWDEQGNLIKEYHIESDAWSRDLLESERRMFKKKGLDYKMVE
jgi:antitoxin component YwqK of YwqJK toxin-antitoxin module